MVEDPIFNRYQQDRRYSSPKVVPVHAHFDSSNELAAVKIQRVFRGFLVRKSVKKISAIRNEVCKVEQSVNDFKIVELIRIDAKERLRVSETLMSLLLKLDSIRGVDFGVRDFRKAVIRKAIALQEMVDSIVADKKESAETDLEIACQIASKQIVVNRNPVKVVDDCGPDDDYKKKSIQILEKLMDDNEKMMSLMTSMLESNEMQTRMLNSLSQRVELMEKTFICDKPRKKKKKKRKHCA